MIDLLAEQPVLSAATVADHLGVSLRSAQSALATLAHHAIVQRYRPESHDPDAQRSTGWQANCSNSCRAGRVADELAGLLLSQRDPWRHSSGTRTERTVARARSLPAHVRTHSTVVARSSTAVTRPLSSISSPIGVGRR